jgi:hypothetical protein
MTEDNYENIKDVVKDCKIENDGIWLSVSDLWRIDGVAVRNANKAINTRDDGIGQMLFQNFVGQRMLIEEIVALIEQAKKNC